MTAPEPPELQVPVTFRPRRLRLTAWASAVALTAASALCWVALPPEIRATFTTSQRVTLLGILALLLSVLAALASSYVRADREGLILRNGLRRHVIGWPAVHKILLRRGDPWALLLLKPEDRPFTADLDAEKLQVMGIQAGDGEAAAEAVATLRRLQAQYRAAQPRG